MATNPTKGRASAPLTLASVNLAPTHNSRATIDQRLRATLAKLCDDADAPLDRNLAATHDWTPLLANTDEIRKVLQVGRDDAQQNFAVAVCLASLTAEKMRDYAAGLGIEGAENVLETMIEYRGRIDSLMAMVECGIARLFAASNEMLGTGAPPSLKLVEA